MIKVAFWFDRPAQYSGGLNYLRNLLFALSAVQKPEIQPYIFFGKSVDSSVVEPFQGLATVIRTSVLDRKSAAWFAHQILHRIFGSLVMVSLVLRPHGIKLISHAAAVYGRQRPFRIIAWIPDFQYLHLPELFPHDTDEGTRRLSKLVRGSDALVLSSFAALADYQKIFPGPPASSVLVLPFTSQPSVGEGNYQSGVADATLKKYDIYSRYFFLPNQFWQHKNHTVVFAAVKELKSRGTGVLVVCSGNLRDYRVRDSAYVDQLIRYIDQNSLGENIKILGQIEYVDVLYLMRNAIAVINPSRFEGWSSTVEESRSMGQRTILSNIPVHLEQNPGNAVFFAPDDPIELADAMAVQWTDGRSGVTDEEASVAAEDLRDRTAAYGTTYEHFVASLNNGQLEKRLYTSVADLPPRGGPVKQ